MRRAAFFAAFSLSLVLVPSAPARIPLPCEDWVHGCDVTAYACDAGVCVAPAVPQTTVSKP